MTSIKDINPIIHSRIRLSIISLLITIEEADFLFLKESTGATDGNLSTHLSKLEQEDYIIIKKEFVEKKPKTICSLTNKGRLAFAEYVKNLEKLLHP